MAIKTKQQLKDYWDANINTNGTNSLNGSELNTGGVDIIDSMAMGTDIVPVEYNFNKVSNVSFDDSGFTEINQLKVPNTVGVYELKLSLTFSLHSTTKSSIIGFSNDGGANWFDFSIESKDQSDVHPFFYAFPKHYAAAGEIWLKVRGKVENGGGTANVTFCDLIIEKKKN